ncbi:putative MerR family transcriptional regulator [Crinalium epipsammum PCC 9333]|uniref:Putative MerR family transcriptional regulator n=1 Tax=Crinalium epipsammum PCC 9333 TaxID=1173022 RepID=K9W208_9CYAN|nr:MerR family transcriptional regulator [Crinalium epipsammum]AFZ13450.1 putative MerR family transcriptional regulator [Crinalium epipsammum PCC 9333]
MSETFFSSKETAEITGCSLRQLQYWRERGVVVPPISATGTGRSIYYSRSELAELIVMEYWLSVGLSFEVAAKALQALKQKAPDFSDPVVQKRFMLVWDKEKKDLSLEEFEREDAIASLDKGQPVIPMWLDQIHHQLAVKLDESTVK